MVIVSDCIEPIEAVVAIDGDPDKGIEDFKLYNYTIREFLKLHSHYNLRKNELVFTYTKIDILKYIGVWDWAIRNCNDKRIVHLMEHGKTKRVRLKNYSRALNNIARRLAS